MLLNSSSLKAGLLLLLLLAGSGVYGEDDDDESDGGGGILEEGEGGGNLLTHRITPSTPLLPNPLVRSACIGDADGVGHTLPAASALLFLTPSIIIGKHKTE